MSPDEYKVLGRSIVDAINSGNLAAFDVMFAPGYIDRNPFPGSTPDLAGYKRGLTEFRVAFPDFHCTIEDEIAIGDRLVHRLTARGTQKGEFMGVAATGRQATWSEIHIGRIANGKVVEHWHNGDQRAMMQQLGFVPAPK